MYLLVVEQVLLGEGLRSETCRKEKKTFLREKTKGLQLKGKIVSHFFALFSHFFRIFPPGLFPSKQRVLTQREQKRRKNNKKKTDQWMLHVSCCTFVLLLF